MRNNSCAKIFLAFMFALVVSFGFFIFRINVNQTANKLYSQGMELYNSEKYQDAYYNFSQISKTSNLYPLALLKQFQCADNLQDKKTALIKLDTLSKKIKDENIRPYVLYSELIYNLDTKKYTNKELISKFNYIQKTYPDSDFAKASAYRIAKLEKTLNPSLAKEKFIEYLEYAPVGKFSIDSLDEVLKLKIYLSDEDKEIIADAYLANSKNDSALKILQNLSFEKSWFKLAKAYRGLNNYTFELNTLEKGLEINNYYVDEKEISSAIDRLIFLYKTDKKQTLNSMLARKLPKATDSAAAYKLASMSKSLTALKLYDYVVETYPDSYWASNSLWEVFWFNYSQKRYSKAYELAKKYINAYPESEDIARISYWGAKALLKQKHNSAAKTLFQDVANKYPLTYYAFLSARQLKISKANKIFTKKHVQKYDIDNIANKIFSENKLLLTLLKFDDYKTIEDLKIDNELVKSWILNKKELYPESVRTAKEVFLKDIFKKEVKFSSYELKLIYPVVYHDLINDYAAFNKISPYLLMSLILEESHFNKNAKSSVGAIGLMQLMPATADYIEKTNVSFKTLQNPKENIRIGAKYFSYLVDYFKGNTYLAILAYNAGHGNVSKWLNNPDIRTNDIDEFIENVPFHETKTYIKKILSSYWVYMNVY